MGLLNANSLQRPFATLAHLERIKGTMPQDARRTEAATEPR